VDDGAYGEKCGFAIFKEEKREKLKIKGIMVISWLNYKEFINDGTDGYLLGHYTQPYSLNPLEVTSFQSEACKIFFSLHCLNSMVKGTLWSFTWTSKCHFQKEISKWGASILKENAELNLRSEQASLGFVQFCAALNLNAKCI